MGNLDDPPFLAVGTEVSAKYKGAFCEAKIRKISKNVKCKVQYTNGTVAFVSDEAVKGQLKVGSIVEVKCVDKKDVVRATIQKIQDCSQYTVVFDDGDITSLKRSALCLKSGRHFAASTTLDQLPLVHPEHIATSVRPNCVSGRRSRKHKKSVSDCGQDEVSDMEEKDIGKVVCVESNDKKKIRDNWFPGLVVAPTAQSSVKTNVSEDYLVRSFKDGKYYTVPKKEITEFTKEIAARVENPTLKTAVEKAILYLDKDELPPHWDRDLLFGLDKNCVTTDSEVYDSDNSDEESIEEKDHFVAQLFKFMDDRGTPLNQAPLINNKDVDLYKLFKVVNNFGGFNKVNKCKQWKGVATKIGHEQSIFCVKQTYQQYLHSFEDFYRKLGCTMLSHPRGVRSRSRFSRSIIRDVDKALPSTSLASADKNKQSSTAKQESTEKKDKSETTVKDNSTSKDHGTARKNTKTTKAEEKLSTKNIEESSKKRDKKTDDLISASSSRNRQSGSKDTSKDSKTKKDSKETFKKENDINENNDKKESDDEHSVDKKVEKKKYARNLFGKSMRKSNKKEKVEKVKSVETGLPNARKKRTIKEHIKTFVKVMTPFKKSKRGPPNTPKNEDMPKLTRSKSKEDLPTKLRKVSAISDQADSVVNQPSLNAINHENPCKVKKKSEDGSEKKKVVRKKKDDNDDKIVENTSSSPVVNSETETSEKVLVIETGDNLVVYYGDKHTTTYDAKVLTMCVIKGTLRYYVHYKGWNSRYDEWIDMSRIAKKYKEPQVDNDADSSKSEQKSSDTKKLPSTNSRTRRSITPNTSSSLRKKSPVSSSRPTRMCTINDRPLSSVGKYTIRDNSDSESDSSNLGTPKEYNKKSQQALKVTKSEQDVAIKTEPLDVDNHKKTLYPKTYPSKEVLMQRNVPKKPKSCVFKVNSNKSEETETCEQVTLKTPVNSEMPPPGDTKILNLDSENEKLKINNGNNDDENETKISPIHYLSPKEKSEKNDKPQCTAMSECSKTSDENIDNNKELLPFPVRPKKTSIVFYESSSEDEENVQLKMSPKLNEELPSTLENNSDESKISGTDFDLNKIRSEMKGLMPPSTSSNTDNSQGTKLFVLDQQVENEVPIHFETVIENEDVYEFKESEPCELKTISSVIEDKHRKVIRHIDPPKLYIEKPVEISSIEATEQSESTVSLESNSNNTLLFDDNVVLNLKEEHKLVVANEAEDTISHSQSGKELSESKTLLTSDALLESIHTNEVEEFSQNETCSIKMNEIDTKDEVLNLSTKPHELPPNNIFSMSEPNETNIVVEDEDDEDDDESKLVIAENDKIDTDYQIDANSLVEEEHNSSEEQREILSTHSSPPLKPNMQQLSNTDLEFRSSYETNRESSLPKYTDDESTTSCNESMSDFQNYETYSHYENQLVKEKVNQPYIDNDDSTKSGFEFESNSKSPTNESTEVIDSSDKFFIDDVTNSDKPNQYDYETEKIKEKSVKGGSLILPELQCREEIVDEETLNNALVIEYNRKSGGYDVQKPSTSKGFFNSINQPSSIKETYYESNTSNDAKSSFFEARQTSVVKSVIFDTNAQGISRFGVIDSNIKDNLLNRSVNKKCKNSVHEPIPSSNKRFHSQENDVNNELFCEETIPGSPTGVTDEQLDQNEKKRSAAQDLYEEREAASAMYAMNQSFRRPIITMTATENGIEGFTNNPQNNEMHDQRHLQFLAEVSSRNVSVNVNQSSDTEPPKLDPQPIEVSRPSETVQQKRKISNDHLAPKRSKTISATTPSTSDGIDKTVEVKMPIPLKDGKPLVSFTPDLDSAQRQALILSRINDLRKEYILVKARVTIIDRRRKKIKKRKRELAKVASMNQNKQSQIQNHKI